MEKSWLENCWSSAAASARRPWRCRTSARKARDMGPAMLRFSGARIVSRRSASSSPSVRPFRARVPSSLAPSASSSASATRARPAVEAAVARASSSSRSLAESCESWGLLLAQGQELTVCQRLRSRSAAAAAARPSSSLRHSRSALLSSKQPVTLRVASSRRNPHSLRTPAAKPSCTVACSASGDSGSAAASAAARRSSARASRTGSRSRAAAYQTLLDGSFDSANKARSRDSTPSSSSLAAAAPSSGSCACCRTSRRRGSSAAWTLAFSSSCHLAPSCSLMAPSLTAEATCSLSSLPSMARAASCSRARAACACSFRRRRALTFMSCATLALARLARRSSRIVAQRLA
mmetsp:Transcript_59169/g.190330  ORF Transcript_59169/g.190330 Transcript_59169/m.190330 type:complete len:349 (-) Transcript_59169:734-1780(-)